MDKITINNQKYPVKFGYNAVKQFCQWHEPSLEYHEFYSYLGDLDFTKVTFKLIEDFAYLLLCIIENGCRIENQECELTLEDITEWLNDQQGALDKVIDIIKKGMPKGEAEKNLKAPVKGQT